MSPFKELILLSKQYNEDATALKINGVTPVSSIFLSQQIMRVMKSIQKEILAKPVKFTASYVATTEFIADSAIEMDKGSGL